MKRFRILILSGLLLGAAPAVSFAECRPACGDGYVCSVTAQGPPTVYGCVKEKASYVRSPRGPAGTQASAGGVIQKGGAQVGSAARTTGPKNGANPPAAPKQSGEAQTITSPRDVASGQATGKRQHKP